MSKTLFHIWRRDRYRVFLCCAREAVCREPHPEEAVPENGKEGAVHSDTAPSPSKGKSDLTDLTLL